MASQPQIRIVIADDHPVVRIGVKNMLQSDAGFEVLGEASDGDEAITATLELLPDILLLDLNDATSARTGGDSRYHEWFADGQDSASYATITTQQIIEALQIGARGIVLKDALPTISASPSVPSSPATTGLAASGS